VHKLTHLCYAVDAHDGSHRHLVGILDASLGGPGIRLAMWPFFFAIMPGRNAFKVQKCASVFTPNVLQKCSYRGNNWKENSLLDVLGREVEKQLPLNNASVVNKDSGLPDLRWNGQRWSHEQDEYRTSSMIFFETASTSSHFETSHL
jgi:hypothetical protein